MKKARCTELSSGCSESSGPKQLPRGELGEVRQTCWMAEGPELSTVYPKGT